MKIDQMKPSPGEWNGCNRGDVILFNVMMSDKCKGTECEEWTQWVMAAFFSMKIQPKLT